jgi:beta-lactamase superfamily II metal-dependent hydrolase
MIVKNRFVALILGSLALVLLLNPMQTASAANPPALGDVLINEYVANSSVEWVELYNATPNDLDISGHYIDDIPNGGGSPKQIPANTIIPAYGYYVMTFSNFLNNGGDDVRFLDPSQNVLDSVSYTSSTAEHSYYRFPDGGVWSNLETANTTPGASNPGTGDQPWTPGTFAVYIFDVGQGDSQLIIFPSGYSILIDVRESSWNSGKGAALIAQKVRAITGGSHVNVGMLSHLHLDHIGYAGYGGFWALLEIEGLTFDKIIDRDAGTWVDGHGGGTVDGLCDPDLEIVWHNAGTVSGTARNWLCYATNPANTNIYPIRELADLWSTTQIAPPDPGAVVTIIQVDGDDVYMADGVTPIQGDHTGSSLPPSENDYSIALKIRYGQIDYATAGDADGVYNASQWGYTYNDVETPMADRFGPVDILRVNHHGSGNSTNQYYVDTLAPTVSLISCGPNSFGHPKQEVVDRLTAANDVYITNYCASDVDYSGTVVVGGDIVILSTDGLNYTVNGAAYVASDPAPPQPVAFAAWDFEDQTRNPSLDLAGAAQAAVGSGLSGESFTAGNPGGTSGKAWSFTHWSLSGVPDISKYVEFQLDLTAYENLSLSFAERRSTSGPRAFAIHYSLDGLNFTEIPTTVTSLPSNTNWRAHAFDLSGLNPQIAGQATVQFRLYGYNASGATGTWRLDDVTFIGEPSVAPPPPPPPPPDPVEFSGWNFEDQTRNASVDLTAAALAAPGSGLNGESFVAGNPGGTSGSAWNFTHWSLTANPDTTKYIQFKVDMSAYQNLSLSFAERRSNTGPLAFEIHYSVDGLNFTPIAGSATSLPSNTNWRAHSFDLSGLNSQISGQPAVYFRIYGYNASGATGTWRLDDVSFVGQ